MSEAKIPVAKQLQQLLDKGKLERIYLFLGEEAGEKEKYILQIAKIFFEGKISGANEIRRFHIESGEFDAAAGYALSQSIFSDKNICVMENIDTLVGGNRSADFKKHIQQTFAELLNNLPETVMIIMTSNENKAPSWIGETNLSKVGVYQFWRYFENDLYNYIIRMFAEKKMSIEPKGASLLLELSGRDVQKIDEAIDRLVSSGIDSVITTDLVSQFIKDTREVSVFEFNDALFRKDRKAFRILYTLLDEGISELQILGLIISTVDKLEGFHHAKNSGKSPMDALTAAGVYGKSQQGYLDYSNAFSLEKLRKTYPKLAETDYQLKSGSSGTLSLNNPLVRLVEQIVLE